MPLETLKFCSFCKENYSPLILDSITSKIRMQLKAYYGYYYSYIGYNRETDFPILKNPWEPIANQRASFNSAFNLAQKFGRRCRFCGKELVTISNPIPRCTNCFNEFSKKNPKVPGSLICSPCIDRLVENY